MKINEVTGISEGVFSGLAGAFAKGVGKAVAAGLDRDFGSMVGYGSQTQVSIDPKQREAEIAATANKLAQASAKDWADQTTQMIAAAQKTSKPGIAASWSDVRDADKIAVLDTMINGQLQGLLRGSGTKAEGITTYTDLPKVVAADAESQRLAQSAVKSIDQMKAYLVRTLPDDKNQANVLKGWQTMMNMLLKASTAAIQRSGTSSKTGGSRTGSDQRVTLDREGKLIGPRGEPFNKNNPQHLQMARDQGLMP